MKWKFHNYSEEIGTFLFLAPMPMGIAFSETKMAEEVIFDF